MTDLRLRHGTQADIATLQGIEHEAGRLYASLPRYAFCTSLPSRDMAERVRVLRSGASLVADCQAEQIGFLLLLPIDGRGHILEMAVAPAHQRQGVGRWLLERAEQWSRERGLAEMTLTTFRDVPWNRPAYERRGFSVFLPGAERVQLRALIEEETAAGFAQLPRVAMRKPL